MDSNEFQFKYCSSLAQINKERRRLSAIKAKIGEIYQRVFGDNEIIDAANKQIDYLNEIKRRCKKNLLKRL